MGAGKARALEAASPRGAALRVPILGQLCGNVSPRPHFQRTSPDD